MGVPLLFKTTQQLQVIIQIFAFLPPCYFVFIPSSIISMDRLQDKELLYEQSYWKRRAVESKKNELSVSALLLSFKFQIQLRCQSTKLLFEVSTTSYCFLFISVAQGH